MAWEGGHAASRPRSLHGGGARRRRADRLRGRGAARGRPRRSPPAVVDNAAEKSQEAASLATGAAESAAEAAEQAGSAAEAAEELSAEAASLITALGFVDDRDVVQVLNTKLGTRVTFVPATIVVTAGTGRKLSIFNDTDAPHGFRIPGLGARGAAAGRRGDAGRAAGADRPADLRDRVSPARAAPARVAGGGARRR